jgi:glycerol dehydrogenase-like iron-containing ADH family enzyme
MSYRNDVIEELHALKREVGHMLTTRAEEWRRISSQKAQTLAADVQALVTTLRDTLAQDEAEIERALEGRVAQVLVTALVAGVAIGWFTRRKP